MTQVPDQVQKALSDPNSAPRVAYWGLGGGEAASEEEEDSHRGPVPVPEVQQQGAVLVVSPAPGRGTAMYM
jgi:hypothetical protein